MKVDTQIEENCRRTISYLQGYSCPKLQLQETELSETHAEYSSQYKKPKNFVLNAGHIKEHLFIKVTVYFPFSFKKISTKQDIASTEIFYRLVPVLRTNKATNSNTSTDPFSAQRKPLYKVIYSSLLDLTSQSHRKFAVGDNEKNKTIVIFSSSLCLSGKRPVRMWLTNLKSLNKLPYTRVFVEAEHGSVEVLESVALFLLMTETCVGKNFRKFFVDAIFCFVKIGFEKRGTSTQWVWWMEVL